MQMIWPRLNCSKLLNSLTIQCVKSTGVCSKRQFIICSWTCFLSRCSLAATTSRHTNGLTPGKSRTDARHARIPPAGGTWSPGGSILLLHLNQCKCVIPPPWHDHKVGHLSYKKKVTWLQGAATNHWSSSWLWMWCQWWSDREENDHGIWSILYPWPR